MPRIDSESRLNDFLATAIAVGLRAAISAHQRSTSASRSASATTALINPICRACSEVYRRQKNHISRAFFSPTTRARRGRSETGVNGSNPRPDLTEDRPRSGNGKVAAGDKNIAAADRKTVNAGDHRFPHVPDRNLQILNWKPDRAASIISSAIMRGLIPSGTKGFFAGACQNDRRHRFVPAGTVDRMDQLLAGYAAE